MSDTVLLKHPKVKPFPVDDHTRMKDPFCLGIKRRNSIIWRNGYLLEARQRRPRTY
jgi:hypothetical protein